MIGNYLSTFGVCVFAYLYPLFLCFKVRRCFFVCGLCFFARSPFSFVLFFSPTITEKDLADIAALRKTPDHRRSLCLLLLIFFFDMTWCPLKKQALEMHKKSPEKLRGWCIYWLVLATFTVFERLTDAFLFFLPLYHEAKVAFVVYLWHPKSQGALYIYDKFVGPTLSKHEGSIDRKIEDVQAKLGDWCFTYSRMAYAYVQKMTLQLLQSLPTAQAAMAQQAGGTGGANGATAAASQPVNPIKKEPIATEAK